MTVSKNKIIVAFILFLIIVFMIIYILNYPEIFKPQIHCNRITYGGQLVEDANCSMKGQMNEVFDEQKRGNQTHGYNSSNVATT